MSAAAQGILLAVANAWRDLNNAEGQIARIKRYPKLTAAMKADLAIHSRVVAASRATLDRLLVVA